MLSRRTLKGISSTSTVTVPDSIFGDQLQQVGAGGVDVARELDLLAGKIAGGIFGELLAENEDGVERRAQLMGHIGQELGLVFRGERQFGSFFFECVAGSLDFCVLALDLGVLIGQKFGLGAQLFIRLLQLALARLKLDGKLLRLREQALSAHGCLDGVEDRTDTLGQKFEEGQ
jgi:hypothetical protein